MQYPLSQTYFYLTLLHTIVLKTIIFSLVSDILNNNNSSTNLDEEKKKLYAHQMVRTDAREQKLEAFFPYQSQSLSSTADKHRSSSDTMERISNKTSVEEDNTSSSIVETMATEQTRESKWDYF